MVNLHASYVYVRTYCAVVRDETGRQEGQIKERQATEVQAGADYPDLDPKAYHRSMIRPACMHSAVQCQPPTAQVQSQRSCMPWCAGQS